MTPEQEFRTALAWAVALTRAAADLGGYVSKAGTVEFLESGDVLLKYWSFKEMGAHDIDELGRQARKVLDALVDEDVKAHGPILRLIKGGLST